MKINALKIPAKPVFTKNSDGGNAATFAAELDAEFIKLMGSVKDAVVQLAAEALAGVTNKSPVDTGQFRANWIVSIGSQVETKAEWTKEEKEAKSGPIAGKNNIKTISEYSSGDDLTFPELILQNNLPYALRLEYGHSNQAPLGMVELTLLELAGAWDATTL